MTKEEEKLYKRQWYLEHKDDTLERNRKWRENNRNQVICVDHDHATGHIRGLLCNGCNTGIGMLKDNIANLEAGIAYLKQHMK